MLKKGFWALLVVSVACSGSVFAKDIVDVSVKAGVADEGLGKGAASSATSNMTAISTFIWSTGGLKTSYS